MHTDIRAAIYISTFSYTNVPDNDLHIMPCARKHTSTHTYQHTCTHSPIKSKNMCFPTSLFAYRHTTHTHTYIHTHKHIRIHPHVHIHTYKNTYIYTFIHVHCSHVDSLEFECCRMRGGGEGWSRWKSYLVFARFFSCMTEIHTFGDYRQVSSYRRSTLGGARRQVDLTWYLF